MAIDYRRMSIQEKQAHALAGARERAIACPFCDMQVMPVDMEAHATSRCQGLREPEPSARWVNAREHAVVRRVPKATLSYWVKRGFVRVRGGQMDREYLLRDLALKLAQRAGFRRR